MFKSYAIFDGGSKTTVAIVPFVWEERVRAWSSIRTHMLAVKSSAFQRTEWAYLIQFIEEKHLWKILNDAMGKFQSSTRMDDFQGYIARPRNPVAVWLPRNVSLLGPLALIVLSFTGAQLLLKGSDTHNDLTYAWIDFLKHQCHDLDDGLARFLQHDVDYRVFTRDDPQNEIMASKAMVRIVFGSNDAAFGIEQLPHPVGSLQYSFADRISEAWFDEEHLDDTSLETLIRVFSVYGTYGCTSPVVVRLLGCNQEHAQQFAQHFVEKWEIFVREKPAMHRASLHTMRAQHSVLKGYPTYVAKDQAAVAVVCSQPDLELTDGFVLQIVPSPEGLERVQWPSHLQTVGYALNTHWKKQCAQSSAVSPLKRFVPLASMHHFTSTWDGYEYFRGCFEWVEVG